MAINELIKELLEDPNFKKEYYKADLAFDIAQMIIDLRIKFGLTQAELARMAGTHQSSIARLERGNCLPSLSFLEKIAESLNTRLVPPKFSILENNKIDTYVSDTLTNKNLEPCYTFFRPYKDIATI